MMKPQMDLWPVLPTPTHPPVWETTSPEVRATLIASLARLIRKMIRPENLIKSQENSNEP
jgi:hypothetical protein